MGRVDQSGIKPPGKHLDDFGKSGINIINRPAVDHEKETPCSFRRCCLATYVQDDTTQDAGCNLVEHSALGQVSILGLEAVMCQNTKHVFGSASD